MNTIRLTWIKLSIITHFLWTHTKKIAKFIWRGFFTFCLFGILINIIAEGQPIDRIEWKVFFSYLAVALIIDCFKTFAKPITTDSDNLMDHIKTGAIHIDRWYDGGVPGSSAYRTSHLGEKGY